MRTVILDGEKMCDIHDFYSQINTQFMAQENWQLGDSLDALDDLLYGGYGLLASEKSIQIIWQNSEIARQNFGVQATLNWLQEKTENPTFNQQWAKQQIDQLLENGQPTYFDHLVEIFAQHSQTVKISYQ